MEHVQGLTSLGQLTLNKAKTLVMEHVNERKFTEKKKKSKVEEIQLAYLASLGSLESKKSKRCLVCFRGFLGEGEIC